VDEQALVAEEAALGEEAPQTGEVLLARRLETALHGFLVRIAVEAVFQHSEALEHLPRVLRDLLRLALHYSDDLDEVRGLADALPDLLDLRVQLGKQVLQHREVPLDETLLDGLDEQAHILEKAHCEAHRLLAREVEVDGLAEDPKEEVEALPEREDQTEALTDAPVVQRAVVGLVQQAARLRDAY